MVAPRRQADRSGRTSSAHWPHPRRRRCPTSRASSATSTDAGCGWAATASPPRAARPPVTNGPGGQMLIGYKLDPHWDVALAGDVQGLLSHLTQVPNGTLSVDTNHQHFDLEAGYSNEWWRVNARPARHPLQAGRELQHPAASPASTSARCTASAPRSASACACRSPRAGPWSAARTRPCSTPPSPTPAAACC